MMSFDRRKRKVLNGPEATGQHCPEGWTVYKGPDPRSRARPNAGWKGRGLWSSYSMYTPWHQKGCKGSRSRVVKFQVRPDALAK